MTETKLYNSPGIFTAPVPPPEPLMEISLAGTPWKAKLNLPKNFEEWKDTHPSLLKTRNWRENDAEFNNRLRRHYCKYLKVFYAKDGKCIRGFMKATNSKGRKNVSLSTRKERPARTYDQPEEKSETGSSRLEVREQTQSVER